MLTTFRVSIILTISPRLSLARSCLTSDQGSVSILLLLPQGLAKAARSLDLTSLRVRSFMPTREHRSGESQIELPSSRETWKDELQ